MLWEPEPKTIRIKSATKHSNELMDSTQVKTLSNNIIASLEGKTLDTLYGNMAEDVQVYIASPFSPIVPAKGLDNVRKSMPDFLFPGENKFLIRDLFHEDNHVVLNLYQSYCAENKHAVFPCAIELDLNAKGQIEKMVWAYDNTAATATFRDDVKSGACVFDHTDKSTSPGTALKFIVADILRCLQNQDADGCVERFSAVGSMRNATFGPSPVAVGGTAIREYVMKWINGFDQQFNIVSQVCEGNKVFTTCIYHASHKGPFMGIEATKKSFELPLSVVASFNKNDKVIDWEWIYDFSGMMTELTRAA